MRPYLAGRHGISAEIAKNGLCRGRRRDEIVCAGFTATKRFPNMPASGFRLEQLAWRTISIGMRVIEGKDKTSVPSQSSLIGQVIVRRLRLATS